MTTINYPTTLELFELFSPQFREVRLKPFSWVTKDGCPTSRFYLSMYRPGFRENANQQLVAEIDVNVAEIGIMFDFAPKATVSIHDRFQESVKAALTELLEDRIFLITSAVPVTTLAHENSSSWCKLHRAFEVIGKPIRGLEFFGPDVDERLQGTWESFIPLDSPEGGLILNTHRFHGALAKLSPGRREAVDSLR